MTALNPVKPETHLAPLKVANDTWLIQQIQPAIIGPIWVYLHSLVIKGKEPIIVDTGTIANREQWMKDVFSIVDPGEVRWIFLSHDDVDHAGNLLEVMEACPNATLISTWFMIERHTSAFNFPLERSRWVNDGDSWKAGDRTLTAITPPLFDSPVTRGLYDDSTGLYWAVDSFATPVPGPMDDISQLERPAWEHRLEFFNRINSPWFKLLDPAKFEQHVDRVQNLDISVVAGCHTPIIKKAQIDDAFKMIRNIPLRRRAAAAWRARPAGPHAGPGNGSGIHVAASGDKRRVDKRQYDPTCVSAIRVAPLGPRAQLLCRRRPWPFLLRHGSNFHQTDDLSPGVTEGAEDHAGVLTEAGGARWPRWRSAHRGQPVLLL